MYDRFIQRRNTYSQITMLFVNNIFMSIFHLSAATSRHICLENGIALLTNIWRITPPPLPLSLSSLFGALSAQ